MGLNAYLSGKQFAICLFGGLGIARTEGVFLIVISGLQLCIAVLGFPKTAKDIWGQNHIRVHLVVGE